MHDKHSILAIYAPDSCDLYLASEEIIRHVMDVSMTRGAHARLDEAIDRTTAIARETAPAGYTLAATLAIRAKDDGYAATMARVNFGTPGVPA
ncbi:MAG: hypothetical protein LC676_10835 [Loktanella sp.]|nr:hypothetical protein [Loktanella sp.]